MIDWLPGADLTYRYDTAYPGTRMAKVTRGVIHTTETVGRPSYNGGATAPTATVMWMPNNTLKVWQHFPLWMSARALRNQDGGVATNTRDCFQMELVGTSDVVYKQKYPQAILWPAAPDAAYKALAAFMRKVESATSIPSRAMGAFKAYPASYGVNNGVRLTFAQWEKGSGWVGHQGVPENTHGDPGALPIARLLAPPKPTGDDMPLSAADLKAIRAQINAGVAEVLRTEGVSGAADTSRLIAAITPLLSDDDLPIDIDELATALAEKLDAATVVMLGNRLTG